jgi:tRNA-binding protein
MINENINWSDFAKIDIRVGTIIKAEVFEEAKKPAYKLWIDFGEVGIKKTSAQITVLYKVENLIGQQIIAIINFEPKQIANFMSECLVLGTINENNTVTLLSVMQEVKNGLKVG